MKKGIEFPEREAPFRQKTSQTRAARGGAHRIRGTPCGLKMDAGRSWLVLEFGPPFTARGQGKDDGSMLHNLPQITN